MLHVGISSQKKTPCHRDAVIAAPTYTLTRTVPSRALLAAPVDTPTTATPSRDLAVAPGAALATSTASKAPEAVTFHTQTRATPPRAPQAPTEASHAYNSIIQVSNVACVSQDQNKDDTINATNNELSTSNHGSGILCAKIFVWDWSFVGDGGAGNVKAAIVHDSGKVHLNISTYTGK